MKQWYKSSKLALIMIYTRKIVLLAVCRIAEGARSARTICPKLASALLENKKAYVGGLVFIFKFVGGINVVCLRLHTQMLAKVSQNILNFKLRVIIIKRRESITFTYLRLFICCIRN